MSALTKEKILWSYMHLKNYSNEDQNMIGATTNLALRTVPVPGGDIAYVKKFGTDYAINDITNAVINTPRSVGAAEWTYTFYGWNGTAWVSMGSVQDSGGVSQAFADGAAFAATKIKIILTRDNLSYSITDGDTINLTTNVDAPLVVYLSGESGTPDLTWYLSKSGSTYYDESYMYGGYRHTPVLGSTKYTYFDIGTAHGAVAAANDDGIEVLDSEIYDEENTFNKSGVSIYAKLGQTPTITSGIGARVTREVSTQYNNSSAIYFNKNGNDANNGKWQSPKLTIANAIANRGANDVVYGGSGCLGNSTFDEAITLNAAFTLESDYAYICKIYKLTSDVITISHVNANIKGIEVYDSSNHNINITAVLFTGNIIDCTSYNANQTNIYSTHDFFGTIKSCISYNSSNKGIFVDDDFGGRIENCICYNNETGINVHGFYPPNQGLVKNCICYSNSNHGIYSSGDRFGGIIENCICFNNNYGITIGVTIAGGTLRDCISYFNTTFDLYRTGQVQTITESNYGTNSGMTIGAGCITTDPEFCKKATTPFKLGISANSGAYRTDTSSEDMGAHLQTIIIGADDVTINGFIIDGQSQYNNAIVLVDTDNDTGLNVKWCTVDNYQGIQLDIYDNDTDTDAIIKNCIIRNGGNGINFAYGGNIVEECLIYNNSVFGIHSDYTGQTFNHNVFYNNQYGIYLESNTAGIIIKNSIFHLNSLYGIYSEVTIIITYCCITDATNNIDISDYSNLLEDPQFINLNIGIEDFHIKILALGYFFNSPCLNRSDDDPVQDIGAWNVVTSVIDNYWKKYESEFNPQVTWGNTLKGYITFTNAEGSSDNYAKDSKRVFVLDFGKRSQVSSKMMRQKMEYFATLIKMRKNDIDDTSDIFRFQQLPTTFLLTGSGVIDATAKTLTHAQTIAENHFKGFHMGIKYSSGVATGTITAATKKLQVAPNPVWADDEHIGFYVHHNGYYYYILDNDNDELTLSDPDDTLENEANINWAIEKYFKIKSNTEEGVFILIDSDDELVDGTYSYYINFIEVKFYTPKFGYGQPITDYNREHSKTGFKVTVEEA